ncbi:protein kinase [Candidatus Woesearchaeota archaeon]|nr:protein kinase [Candidatus Woesearchaeota archaeon]
MADTAEFKTLESMLKQIKPGSTLSHYQILEKLGEGGMGVVWKAKDKKLSREVAIKFLPDKYSKDLEWLNRFKREATTLAAINHPNIITIYAIEEFEGYDFITIEYVQGKSLAELIPQRGMPLEQFYQLAIPLAGAVEAAHKKNVIHGDLKPSNIMINNENILKVLDFGLASFQEKPEQEPVSDKTKTLALDYSLDGISVLGTYQYMAPEHILGKPKSLQTDVFALGLILYEMMTGKKPFQGNTKPELIGSILKETPRRPGEINLNVPRQLDNIIMKCLNKNPAFRFISAGEVRSELELLNNHPEAFKDKNALSIAVLPFDDISLSKDQEYFCDGLADELMIALGRIKGMRVASRNSTFQFKNKNLDSREIGDKLGVKALIEGSVSKYNGRIRISVILTNVADGFQLWNKTYNRELKDIFQIQNEIAENVVKSLKVTLTPGERRAIKQIATENVEAYEFYLQGRKFFYNYNNKGMKFAQQMFKQAIQVDPNYALAHAGIADCLAFIYMNADNNPDHIKQADISSKLALELDPGLAEVHVSRGVLLSLMKQKEESDKEYEAAIKINPNSFEAHYFYARECYSRGEREKAIEHYEQAYEIRPDDYQSPILAGVIYGSLGMKKEEEDARRRGVKLAERHLAFNPGDTRALYMGANALIALGQREKGLAWANQARELEPNDPMLLYNLGCIYSITNEQNQALDCLEQALKNGFANKRWLEHDSDFDPLREQPRFKKILERLS